MVEMSVITAVIIGVSQILKQAGVNVKFIPIINIIVGIGLTLLVSGSGDTGLDIFNGIISGLTASGLYSGIKNVSQYFKGDE